MLMKLHNAVTNAYNSHEDRNISLRISFNNGS